MMELLKTIWFVLVYLVDWTCPHKRAYWHKVLLGDAPVITYDFGVLITWMWYPEILAIVGKTTGVVAGLLACYLSYVRIKHVRLQIKKLEENQPPEQ